MGLLFKSSDLNEIYARILTGGVNSKHINSSTYQLINISTHQHINTECILMYSQFIQAPPVP